MGLIEWLQHYNGAISALATVAIGVFTLALVRVSNRQAKLTREALIADKRAHVMVVGLNPAKGKDGGWIFRAIWRNSGDTPTKNLKVYLRHLLSEHAPSMDYETEPIPRNARIGIDFGVGIIPPKSEADIGGTPRVNEAPISAEDLLRVEVGKRTLFVMGRAEYEDVFDSETLHVSEFCWQIRPFNHPDHTLTTELPKFAWQSHVSGNSTFDVPKLNKKFRIHSGEKPVR